MKISKKANAVIPRGAARSEAMYKMLKTGATQREVAIAFDVQERSVQNALYKFEPELKGARTEITYEQKVAYLKKYHKIKDTMSLAKCAEQLDLPYTNLRRWVRELYPDLEQELAAKKAKPKKAKPKKVKGA